MLYTSPEDLSRFIGDDTGASYQVAHFMMSIVDWLLGIFGLEHNITLVTFLYAAVVLGISIAAGYIFQVVILWICRQLARHWSLPVYDALTKHGFFHKLCRVIPPLVFLGLISFTLTEHDTLSQLFTKIAFLAITIEMALAINALIMAAWTLFDARENKRKLPLRGLSELVRGIVWIIAAIVCVCVIFDRSPGALLAGLGAFAAVLMLIFKDSILGLVAGVQLAENDSLHVGDWIKVKGTDANGTVQEVTLVSVKVLNWDKTTTTLPPYSLISQGFTNYRTMQQSNTRRVCRSYMIDADSVLPTTPEMLEEIRKVPFMDEYITRKLEQKAAGKVADVNNPDGLVNGTIDTNLGLFRAYFKMWLDANPHISHDSDCFISTLPQTSGGIPLQVYCFTNTSAWFAYEAIQDTIFEQLAAMLTVFSLYTFENPSGRDTLVDGYLSAGGKIAPVFGMAQPFFKDKNYVQESKNCTAASAPASAAPSAPK